MFNIIKLEFMKWKRSKILLSAFIGTLITPLVAIVSAYAKMQDPKMPVNWDSYFGVALQVNLSLIFPILFGGLTAYVFVQEYQDRTILSLFTLPQSRVKILIAKMVVILGTLFAIIMGNIIITFLGGLLVLKEPITFYILARHSYFSIVTSLMSLCFIPIFAYISIRTKNFIPPLIAATGFTFLNFVSISSKTVGPYVPTAIPVFYFLNALGWTDAKLPYIWSMLIPIFLISMFRCSREYLNQDIH